MREVDVEDIKGRIVSTYLNFLKELNESIIEDVSYVWFVF